MELGGSRMTRDDSRQVFCWLNAFGLIYFWSSLCVFFYVTTFIYIPALYQNDPETLENRRYLSYLLMLQVLVNYFLCIFKNSYFDPKKITVIPNSMWGKCSDCKAPKPPQTHHCPSCRRCVLRRDHHCFLTTTCIGFMNLRYLIVYCVYSALASGYTLYMGYEYVKLAFSPITWNNWHHFVLPYSTFEFILGWQTFKFLMHLAVLYWSAITAFCGSGMACMQTLFALFHMTQRDLHQGRTPDFTTIPNVCEEMRRIFGPWFLLNFLFPLFWLSPKGDGIHLTDSVAGKLI